MEPARSTTQSLGPDEVHVWLAYPERIDAPELLEAYAALEDEDDRERRRRLRFARDRHERLVSVALVRTTLSRYARRAPASWRFSRTERGRPEPLLRPQDPCLRFNLSHARSIVACAVTLERDVGVDVEATDRRGETVALAERYFSPDEVAALRAVPVARQRERFFDYWTLKEAYIKARGLGLALPLRHFTFDVATEPIRVSFAPELDDDADDWQFELSRPSPGHVLAVAARLAGARGLAVSVRATVPLEHAV